MAKRIFVGYMGYKEMSRYYFVSMRGTTADTAEPDQFQSPSEVMDYLMHRQDLQLGKRNTELVLGNGVPDNAKAEFTAFEKKVKKLAVKVQEGKKRK